MNLYIISIFDKMVARNVVSFSKQHFVKSAIQSADHEQISLQLNRIADFYFSFLHDLNLMPMGASKKDYFIDLDSPGNDERTNQLVAETLRFIDQNELMDKSILPLHIRYTDENNIHLIAGLALVENKRQGFLHMIDLIIPKSLLINTPSKIAYVKEVLDLYYKEGKPKLRELIQQMGIDYGQFQNDCHALFGDSFYAFLLKLKMLEAADGIIYTHATFKEIAYENGFVDYANMYKTFAKHKLRLTLIPRLAFL